MRLSEVGLVILLLKNRKSGFVIDKGLAGVLLSLAVGSGKMELKVGVRKCILPGCERSFIPVVKWQMTCCEAHGRRMRWLRRKERINKALARVARMDNDSSS
jgi:hypothetical protein